MLVFAWRYNDGDCNGFIKLANVLLVLPWPTLQSLGTQNAYIYSLNFILNEVAHVACYVNNNK